jgi:hypothetical protein
MARDPLEPHEEIIDTALQPDDDDPTHTDDGYTALKPSFDEYDMLRAVEDPPIDEPQAELPPQEAYDLMKYSAPLDKEELQILRETPFLGPELSFVDDADHEEWIMNRMRDRRQSMDFVLEDAMYGDQVLADELGFGIPRVLKRAAGGVARGARGAARGVAKVTSSVVKKFVPSRDAQKAAIVKRTNARLVQGRANFLQMADVKNGIKNRPRSYYVALAKPWSKSRLAAGGLPTTFTSGEVAATILGEELETMGSWWNPLSWFQAKTKYIVENAQGQIAEMSPSDFQAWVQQQQQQGAAPDASAQPQDASATPDASMQPPDAPPPDAYGPPPDAYGPPPAEAPMEAYPDQQQGDDLFGEDRWARDIDLHSWVEDASRNSGKARVMLESIAKKAAAGDPAAVADMKEIRNYQKETGMHVMGEDADIIIGDEADYELMVGDDNEDGAGAFSDFAGDVLGHHHRHGKHGQHGKGPWRKQITDKKYRELTMQSAQAATANPTPSAGDLMGAHKRLHRKLVEKEIGVVDQSGDDMMGAWLYKLSPGYWLKPARERKLIDAEKTSWQKTQDLERQGKKTERALDEGQRAAYQVEKAKEAQARSEDLEAQLEETEKAITSGDFVGADPTAAAEAATEGKKMAAANAARAGSLAAKLESGEKLTPEELTRLRSCLKMCGHLKKLHDELHAQQTGMPSPSVSTSGYHEYKAAETTQTPFLGAFVGEPVSEILGESRAEILGENRAEILGAAARRTSSVPTHYHLVAMTALAATNPAGVMPYAKKNGIKLSANDMAKIRAAAADARAIMKHPQYNQIKMRGNGEGGTLGSDAMGFSWGKLVTAPLALAAIPAAASAWVVRKSGLPGSGMLSKAMQFPVDISRKLAAKGGWRGQLGVPGAPGTPGAPGAPGAPGQYGNAGARRAAIMAARQRQLAAQARINAANAASADARAQYAAQAAAADAEAQAQEAEAQAQQAQSDAASADAMPDPYADGGAPDAESGTVTVLGADWFSGAFVGEIEDQNAKKIVVEAQKNTPTGKKIRAGATLYHKAKKGDKKSQLAIAKIQHKAKQGDPQAQRDYNAVKAGKIAVHAKVKGSTRVALKAHREAANKKGIAIRKHMEANAGKRLGEHTRRKKLAKIAKVEHMAAHGHPKAKAAVARTVAKANQGDRKAQTTVAALKLAKHVRTAGKTPAERKRLHAAHKVVYHARHGNKKAIRQIALINAAAKHGQPNAVRAKARLKVAARVEHAVATGKISTPPSTAARHAAAHKKIKKTHARIAAGVATKEEALAAAREAKAVGAHDHAASLALHAHRLPSAKQPIKDAAAVAAAANNGSKDAQAIIDRTLQQAQGGDPKAINSAGKLAAAQSVDAVNRGKPMPIPIAEATLVVERAQAGDEEAKRTVRNAGAAAQDPDHHHHDKGVESAVALTAAAAVLAATAGTAAHEHWKDEARKATGTHVDSAEHGKAEAELAELMAKLHDGTGTYRDGVRARELAMALDKPKLAAEISAIMPPRDFADTPMSSLPDLPEPAISGPMSFVREGLRALLFVTSDPFGNYREGIRSRGQS